MRVKCHSRPQFGTSGRSEALSNQFILGLPGPSVSAEMINCSLENCSLIVQQSHVLVSPTARESESF